MERLRFTAPILVTLCIDYQASLDPSHHQTGYAFYLTQTLPETKGIAYVDPVRRGAIPAATLNLSAPQIFSNQYAN